MAAANISRRTFTIGVVSTAIATTLAACHLSGSTDNAAGAHPLGAPKVNYQPDFSAGPTIFPQPGARTAQAHSQITFRGISQAELVDSLRISGTQSGVHTEGKWIAHSDGYGVSFQPAQPFTAGETVTVSVDGVTFQHSDGAPTFTVAKPIAVPLSSVLEDQVEEANRGAISYVSAPSLEAMACKLIDGKSKLASNVSMLASAHGKRGVGIYSHTGELVYWQKANPDYWYASHTQVVTVSGQPVLNWFEGKANIDLHYSQGEEFFLNSSYQSVSTRFSPGNGYQPDLHEFFVTNHNSAFISIYNPIQVDLTEIGGKTESTLVDGVVQEIDLSTGAVLFEWHAFDNVALGESFANFAQIWDWVHLNSVKENARGEILVSLRDTSSVMLLNHESGKRIWKLGGATAEEVTTSDAAKMDGVKTFTLGEGVRFSAQHDARFWADGRLSLYDNEDSRALTTDSEYDYSRGLVLDLNYEDYSVNLHQEFVHPDHISGLTQGSVVRLDDGGALVSWGNKKLLTEFDQKSKVLAHWELTGALSTYRVELTEDWAGTPNTSPSAVFKDGTLYVSWNGATQVATWRVYAAGEQVAEAKNASFETAIEVGTATPDTLTVDALDADGAILGAAISIETAD